MTTSIITARASTFSVRFDAITAVLRWPLQAWRRWREHQHAMADLVAMSDAELKDLGLERDSHQVAVARGRAYVERICPF